MHSKRPKSEDANRIFTPRYKRIEDKDGRVYMPNKINVETLKKLRGEK